MSLRRLLVLVCAESICCAGLAACSGPSPPALPLGWKTVTYHGIGIDVPKTWVVLPWFPNCGIRSPTVFFGPQRSVALRCERNNTTGEVVLGSLFPYPQGSGNRDTINGVRVDVVAETVPGNGFVGEARDFTRISVMLPAAHFAISVAVGESSAFSGGAPGRARKIVNTIHNAKGSTTATNASRSEVGVMTAQQAIELVRPGPQYGVTRSAAKLTTWGAALAASSPGASVPGSPEALTSKVWVVAFSVKYWPPFGLTVRPPDHWVAYVLDEKTGSNPESMSGPATWPPFFDSLRDLSSTS